MTEQDKLRGFSGDHHPPPPQPQPFPAPPLSDPSAPVGERRLGCGGLGFGWCLFILGFFLIIPWYVGAIIMLCSRVDYREKRGYIACIVAAVVITIGVVLQEIVFHKTKTAHYWFYRKEHIAGNLQQKSCNMTVCKVY